MQAARAVSSGLLVSLLASPLVWASGFGCAEPGAPKRPEAAPSARAVTAAAAPARTASIDLVESVPVETTLDHPDVADAPDVWPKMIDGATATLDFAEFYASEAEPPWRDDRRLTATIEAIGRALARGVRVRFLADAKFAKTYPDTLASLEKAGAAVRRLDVEGRTGGVLHAKYFIVDGAELFLGSQNFDWRALSHIFEMGVRARSPVLAGAALEVFETDWAIAGGAADAPSRADAPRADAHAHAHAHAARTDEARTGERVTFVASPKGWLPDEAEWDLPALVALLDGARRSIDLEVLTYSTKERRGEIFTTLDDALRRAAGRGVHVRLLVSEWGMKGDPRASVDALLELPNVTAKFFVVPKWSRGDVPFARVAHAKYLVVDGERAWVGTSNWEGDYFTRSRNVGVVVEGGALPKTAENVFEAVWTSVYASPP